MIPGDKNFSISRENYKTRGFGTTGIFNNSDDFKIQLQTPTVTVSVIKRI